MAQSGYTPILIYASGTTTNVPLAANMTSSISGAELALNYADGKLFYKDGSGVVQVLATKGAGTIGGSNTQVQYNSSGALAGSANMTFNGTVLTSSFAGPVAATTLSASSTVSGTGFSTYLASPPAIGGTAAAAGAFTTLSASSTVTLSGGTANGVMYLDGSKNITTGSVLTFDGAILGVNGISVGRGAGAVSTNTAVGASALFTNSTNGQNTVFGYNAGYYSTGSANTYIGYNAGPVVTASASGSNNTALGVSALQANTTASNNTAVGYQAGYTNSTGIENVAVGTGALYSNTTGSQNTAVGRNALYSNTTGINAAFGQFTLYGNTTGTANAAFGGYGGSGNQTMLANSTGSYNSAFGMGALAANTTASNNTAVGYQAGYSNTTSGGNTLLGYQAGYTQNNTSGNAYNTLAGFKAGYSITTGYGNTFIGANATLANGAGNAVTTGYNNTIIGSYSGNQGGLDIRTASNYIVLSDGDGNPRGIFDNSGNLLVGTTSATTYTGNSVIVAQGGASPGGASVSIQHISGSSSGNYYLGFNLNGAGIGSVTQSGTTAVLYNVTSDQRLKENIQDADSASSLIDSLQVRQFDWKTDGNHQRYGFVAQELVTVAPEAVHQPADPDDMMAVDYSKLVPMLVKEVQSLRKRLADAGIA